ncbi:MAG: hypothetical protein AMJ61_11675 [Desulfobacterales bacterium SG8_35_2]|nr:MAG: hypothetical protein AMJ61_11675 [Desulfobacterales bacterium SG8_35_2]
MSYFGAIMTEAAEKKRDVFLPIYITCVSLVPHNEKVNEIHLTLVRKASQKVFNAPQQIEPVTPHVPEKSFDLRNSDPFTLLVFTSFLNLFFLSIFSCLKLQVTKSSFIQLVADSFLLTLESCRKICLNKFIDTVRISTGADQKPIIVPSAYSENLLGIPGALIELQTVFKGDYLIVGTVDN